MVNGHDDLFADGCVSVPQAKEITTLSRSTLYGLMERGELVYTTVGRRRLIPRRALIELCQRGLVRRAAVSSPSDG
jgi:excisionase family DNA binding protein